MRCEFASRNQMHSTLPAVPSALSTLTIRFDFASQNQKHFARFAVQTVLSMWTIGFFFFAFFFCRTHIALEGWRAVVGERKAKAKLEAAREDFDRKVLTFAPRREIKRAISDIALEPKQLACLVSESLFYAGSHA